MEETPKTPIRSDHRILLRLVSMVTSGVSPLPSELDLISRVFYRAGGSWEEVVLGAPKDLDLLKRILKVAYKKGFLTKKPQWGARG